ncbi:sister chromatid cohesion protein SCC4-like [Olea europaea var. sylvestris]|uniref:sister chromatid cohesion protein SCC4-like n=1 Tax=Olea europaea var. sylvestris TaxID=158386 RepID=UPI000C1D2845|nr:sister chromatid cohesion protein SCC4-like [Olea europaea var. sylvestris]
MCYPELQMFFATSILHVRVVQWDSTSLVEESVNRCHVIWESIEQDKVSQNLYLFSCFAALFLSKSMSIQLIKCY